MFIDRFIKTRKIPYTLSLFMLMIGASLIVGFLSLAGMYALAPIVPLAIAAFGLSTGYEGEILRKNLKEAFDKWFNRHYLPRSLAKKYLLEHFPNLNEKGCPQFFKDYAEELKLLHHFSHKKLDAESAQRKKQLERSLKDKEHWFASRLFNTDPQQEDSEYAQELDSWLLEEAQEQELWQQKLENQKFKFKLTKGFSILAALFMGLSTTYLIAEAFSIIPFFAALSLSFWPILIAPMALIAGLAYGMLTFNAVTDIIHHETVQKWFQQLRDELNTQLRLRTVLMLLATLALSALAVALTLFTAGTWWTVVSNSRPIFEWMGKMPAFVMGVINPIITGFSSIFFNFLNTIESLKVLDSESRKKKGFFERLWGYLNKKIDRLKEAWNTENPAQFFNPFRIILKLTITPLRYLLFLGHLVSIAVTSDRAPGVSEKICFWSSFASEFAEDWHYFFGHDDEDHDHGGDEGKDDDHHDHDHDHGHHHECDHEAMHFQHLLKERLDVNEGHSHDKDIPTWALDNLAMPIYGLAALWDWGFSQCNRYESQLTLQQAWDKQRGNQPEERVELPVESPEVAKDWHIEHAIFLIEKHQKRLSQATFGKNEAQEKIDRLEVFKSKLRDPKARDNFNEILNEEKDEVAYNKHRWFPQDDKTTTQQFIENFPARLCMV